MINRIKLPLLVLLLSMNIDSTVFAHSGGTDSNGGHHVTATGEYHYHHGYPAHDHINGECPYNNKVQSDSTSIHNYGKSSSTSVTPISVISNNLYLIIGAATISFYVANSSYKRYKENKQYEEERTHFKSLYEGKTPYELAKVPENIQFDEQDLPIQKDDSGLKWGSTYTVFLTRTGDSYHRKLGCSNSSYSAHIFTILRSKSGCKKCVKTHMAIPNWYIEYIKIVKIKKKYKID